MEWPNVGVACNCSKFVECIDGDAGLGRVKRSVDDILIATRRSLVCGCCAREWHPLWMID